MVSVHKKPNHSFFVLLVIS